MLPFLFTCAQRSAALLARCSRGHAAGLWNHRRAAPSSESERGHVYGVGRRHGRGQNAYERRPGGRSGARNSAPPTAVWYGTEGTPAVGCDKILNLLMFARRRAGQEVQLLWHRKQLAQSKLT